MFFQDWYGIFRVLIVGILAYAALILWLRLSGKRTLSKWNAFDFVVTIALGSTLATVILSKDVVLGEGVIAFALLIFLQYIITWLSVRFAGVRRIVKAEPALLLDKGRFMYESMSRQRVTESEIRAAARKAGVASLENIKAVVLETDGSFSIIKQRAESESDSAMADVSR